MRFECVCTTCTFEHYVICSGDKVTIPPPPPNQVRRCLYAYDSCDYPKRPIRQQRHSRPDRIAFYLYDRDDANDKLYDKRKLPETTHMTETTMWKPGLTCHWRPLCRRDRTQFHRGDRVAAVVWVVLGRFGSFWVVLGRFGSFWIIARVFSYGHPSRTTGTTETTIWQPGFKQKKWKPPETTICKPGLTQVSFLHVAQQGDFTN